MSLTCELNKLSKEINIIFICWLIDKNKKIKNKKEELKNWCNLKQYCFHKVEENWRKELTKDIKAKIRVKLTIYKYDTSNTANTNFLSDIFSN